MKNRNIFVILIIITVLTSCVTKTDRKGLAAFKDVDTEKIQANIKNFLPIESNAITIKIPNVNGEKRLKISEIADSISIISLSNEPEAVIGTINKIEIKENIYVLDRYKTKTVKVFDTLGNYITTIGKQGQGPEEYIEPTDFLVTEEGIQIYDQFRQRIMFFNRKGTFIRSKRVPFIFTKFYQFSPNHYIFHALDADNDHLVSIVDYLIFETDSNFVVKNRGFHREKNLYSSFLNETNFSPSESEEVVYYHPPFNDTIFAVSKTGKFINKFIIDFGKRKLPEHYLLKKNSKSFFREYEKNNYAFFLGHYFVLDNQSLFFTFTIAAQVYYCLFDGKSNMKIGSITQNDLNRTIPFNHIIGYKENTLIGYVQPMDILEIYKKINQEEFRNTHSAFVRMIEKMTVDDNPILVFYHVKKKKS